MPRRAVHLIRTNATARLYIYSFTLILLGLALWLGPLGSIGKFPLTGRYSVDVPIWAVFLACYGCSLLFVELRFQNMNSLVSFTDIPLVMGLVLVDPRILMACYVIGVATSHWSRRGIRPGRDLANMGIDLCVVGSAYLTFHALQVDTGHPLAGAGLLALGLSSVVASCLVGPLVLFTGLAFVDGKWELDSLIKAIAADVMTAVSSCALALIGLLIVFEQPLLILAVLPPMMLVLVGQMASSDSKRRALRMEFLYKLSTALNSTSDVEARAGEVLELIAGMFTVQEAALIMVQEHSTDSVYVSVRGGVAKRDTSHELSLAELEVLTRLSEDVPVAQSGDKTGIPVKQLFNEKKAESGMVALLRSQQKIHGMLLLLDPKNYERRLATSEASLLATVGRQVSIAMEHGQLAGAIEVITQENSELAEQARRDPLTGLVNRSFFHERLEHALERFPRSDAPFAVIFADLDGFKAINDEHGHEAGDQVLRLVAERIRTTLRKPDTAARFGGDEFAILVEDLHSGVDARLAASRLVAAIAAPVELADRATTVRVGASIGVALVYDQADIPPIKELMRRADSAMYKAKERGKGRYVLFEPSSQPIPLPRISRIS